jgi:hypothetical protein
MVRAADLVADYVNGFALAEAAQSPRPPEDRGKYWHVSKRRRQTSCHGAA